MKAMILFIATFGVLSASAQPLPSLPLGRRTLATEGTQEGEGPGVGSVTDTLRLTLDDCITMARRQSVDALAPRHRDTVVEGEAEGVRLCGHGKMAKCGEKYKYCFHNTLYDTKRVPKR